MTVAIDSENTANDTRRSGSYTCHDGQEEQRRQLESRIDLSRADMLSSLYKTPRHTRNLGRPLQIATKSCDPKGSNGIRHRSLTGPDILAAFELPYSWASRFMAPEIGKSRIRRAGRPSQDGSISVPTVALDSEDSRFAGKWRHGAQLMMSRPKEDDLDSG